MEDSSVENASNTMSDNKVPPVDDVGVGDGLAQTIIEEKLKERKPRTEPNKLRTNYKQRTPLEEAWLFGKFKCRTCNRMWYTWADSDKECFRCRTETSSNKVHKKSDNKVPPVDDVGDGLAQRLIKKKLKEKKQRTESDNKVPPVDNVGDWRDGLAKMLIKNKLKERKLRTEQNKLRTKQKEETPLQESWLFGKTKCETCNRKCYAWDNLNIKCLRCRTETSLHKVDKLHKQRKKKVPSVDDVGDQMAQMSIKKLKVKKPKTKTQTPLEPSETVPNEKHEEDLCEECIKIGWYCNKSPKFKILPF